MRAAYLLMTLRHGSSELTELEGPTQACYEMATSIEVYPEAAFIHFAGHWMLLVFLGRAFKASREAAWPAFNPTQPQPAQTDHTPPHKPPPRV